MIYDRIHKRLIGLMMVAGLVVLPGARLAAQDDGQPLSAIGWLDEAFSHPLTQSDLVEPGWIGQGLDQTDPMNDAAGFSGIDPSHDAPITVATISGPLLDQIGLFPAERIGLGRDFWTESPVSDIVTGLAALPTDTAPSALQLTFRLLLAELAPPTAAPSELRGTILTARIDKLIAMGALEPAAQLLDAAPFQTAALNSRAFDIALLLGEEDLACARMDGQIASAFGHGAQIFCLARRGEWQAAFSTLKVTRSLGLLDPSEAALLLRFLDEEDEYYPPPPPAELTPLGWRILEALGDPVPTATLPVAYAYADLRGTSGWRAQLDAAERLTRAGVMQPNRLLGLYAQRRPAASGGVWERVRAVQQLDQALNTLMPDAIGDALETAWPLFASVELETVLAQMFADRLADAQLPNDAKTLLWQILLLTQTRSDRLAELAPQGSTGQLATALALETPPPAPAGSDMTAAIAAAFAAEPVPAPGNAADAATPALLPAGQLFEALGHIAQGMAGDPRAAQHGLQSLRALGLSATARQIGIELLLLERRG